MSRLLKVGFRFSIFEELIHFFVLPLFDLSLQLKGFPLKKAKEVLTEILGIPEEQKVLFLLPIMIYHSFQLFYVSALANKIAKSNI